MGSSCSTGKVLERGVAPPHSGGALRTLRAVTWGTDDRGPLAPRRVRTRPWSMLAASRCSNGGRRATATVRMAQATVERLRELPKGDALACAEVAGIMAAKRTSDLIPLCHPLPLTHERVRRSRRCVRRDHGRRRDHRADGRRDGGADGGLRGGAGAVRHGQGRGRGAGRRGHPPRGEDEVSKTAVLTVSDGVSNGTREDLSGDVLAELLEAEGFDVTVVPDEANEISEAISELAESAQVVLTTGGTGVGPRDDARGDRGRLDRWALGIAEDPRRRRREDAARNAVARNRGHSRQDANREPARLARRLPRRLCRVQAGARPCGEAARRRGDGTPPDVMESAVYPRRLRRS